uniref:Uncharacterized protein n=1 Tax=Strongyloides venezuelensis TaxID=75913 RepID=A0A0K0FA46_STRVS
MLKDKIRMDKILLTLNAKKYYINDVKYLCNMSINRKNILKYEYQQEGGGACDLKLFEKMNENNIKNP